MTNLKFSDITLVSGLKSDTLLSTVGVEAKSKVDAVFGLKVTSEFLGSIATTVRDDPIAGLTATDTFTIDATTSSGTTSIAIDLSGVSGDLNLDNIVDYINTELVSNGITSSLSVERVSEDEYAIKIKLGSGETLDFNTPSSQSAAVYAAGTYGAGLSADGH